MLSGLTVVELAGDPASEYTGKLLADMGASVVKVEPAEGSLTRSTGPFAGGTHGPNTSLTYWFYNGGKRSVVLEDPRDLDRLLATADVLLTGLRPAEAAEAGLDHEALLETY